MTIERVVAPLQRLPLFAGLKAEQVAEIGRVAERLRFNAGDVITQAGAAGDGAFLVVSGVAVRSGQPGVAIEEGSLIGEMAMLTEHDYGSTIVARDRVLCLKIGRAALHALMLTDPSIAEHLEQQIAERLARMAETLREIDAKLAGLWAVPPALPVAASARA
jgi:signal-transduction protein with cAMP-binding, CBS, and nucleotidyltransferase domain